MEPNVPGVASDRERLDLLESRMDQAVEILQDVSLNVDDLLSHARGHPIKRRPKQSRKYSVGPGGVSSPSTPSQRGSQGLEEGGRLDFQTIVIVAQKWNVSAGNSISIPLTMQHCF